jgi:hypothetical protein
MAAATESAIRESWGVVQEALRVDRDKHTVFGAKLVSVGESRNRKRYGAEPLRSAAELYGGAKINDDHPEGSAVRARRYGERMGNVLKGTVEFREGQGLFGNLLMNPKHALYEQFMWDAENAPQNVALSHNILALQRLEPASGVWVIEKITRVISVDVVGDPGSTNGLFESEDFDAMKTINKSLKALLAEAVPSMQPAYEAIIVANGIDLSAEYAVGESLKPNERLLAAIDAIGLAAMRESANPKRFELMRVAGLLGDDVRGNVAPAAEKYKSAGSAVPSATATAASGAGGDGNSDLRTILNHVESIGKRLDRLDQAEIAESILERHGVEKTKAIVQTLCSMSSKEAMELYVLQNLTGARHADEHYQIARESGGGGGSKAAENPKDLLSRIRG